MSSYPAREAAQTAEVLPFDAPDGAHADLMLVTPSFPASRLLYWLPAMGVPARHYLPLAQALADDGIAVAIHEWRGIGSSNRRAGRRQNWGYRELLEDITAGLATARQRLPQVRLDLGGHSLGGQLAFLHAALHPAQAERLLLVGSGAPYWRCFNHGWWLRQAYRLAPLLASLCGHLPGRALRFAGNEARGVIADWARSGRTGRYAARHVTRDLETALADLHAPVLAIRLADDWLAPAASLDWLIGKTNPASCRSVVVGSDRLGGARADHFSWMKMPRAIADEIASWRA